MPNIRQRMEQHKIEFIRQLAGMALGREIPSHTGVVMTGANEKRSKFMGDETVQTIPFKEYHIPHNEIIYVISLCELNGNIYVYQDEQGHYLYLQGTMTKASNS